MLFTWSQGVDLNQCILFFAGLDGAYMNTMLVEEMNLESRPYSIQCIILHDNPEFVTLEISTVYFIENNIF